MGIMDFVFGSGDKVKGKSDAEKSSEIESRVKGLELDVDSVKVDVAGDTARVTGAAKSQADREKAVLAVGNIEGIAKVDDRVEVTGKYAESAPAVFYTVQPGDSLSKIAQAEYGDATKYNVIFEANQPMLKDPNQIYPGQVLRIPPAA